MVQDFSYAFPAGLTNLRVRERVARERGRWIEAPIRREGRVVEKITRIRPNAIGYEFLVTDPSLWDTSWGGEYPMELADGPMFEYACHEGNYGMVNTLRGFREDEKPRNREAR